VAESLPQLNKRISTLLFAILAAIAVLVIAGLVAISLRLLDLQRDLATLRDGALPRLVKLAQLAQEASATSSIAPALSTKPSRFEFETLLSRIKDKEASQKALIEELAALFPDPAAARVLRDNGDLLIANLGTLTDQVRAQIDVGKRLQKHGEKIRGNLSRLARLERRAKPPWDARATAVAAAVRTDVFRLLNMLLDRNKARFKRNRAVVEKGVAALQRRIQSGAVSPQANSPAGVAQRLMRHWAAEKDKIYADKGAELANEFKIKALVEENSLIANRLLTSAASAFSRANGQLEAQIQVVNQTLRAALVFVAVVFVAFAAGNFLVGIVLRRRVFRRLDRLRDALRQFAERRVRAPDDPIPDEIGEIAGAMSR